LDCIYSPENQVFQVFVCIRIGQKFKFVINDGSEYVVADRYIKTQDAAGNLNNVFLFHQRNLEQNNKVKATYSIHKQSSEKEYFTLEGTLRGPKSPNRISTGSGVGSSNSNNHKSPHKNSKLQIREKRIKGVSLSQKLKESHHYTNFNLAFNRFLTESSSTELGHLSVRTEVIKEESQFQNYQNLESKSLGSPRALHYDSIQDKETIATNYEEECLQYASFENPLSFTEEEVEQMWIDRESTIPDKSTN